MTDVRLRISCYISRVGIHEVGYVASYSEYRSLKQLH